MELFEAIILGLIQGLTEFIPVSSSGHLVIAQHIFGSAGDHLFLEWINVGTVIALLIFFRKRIGDIIRQVFVARDLRVATMLLVAALPAGTAGFLLADQIETNPFFSSTWTVAAMLILVGIVMVVVERLPRLSPVDDLRQLRLPRAAVVGVAQMLALVPGTSRSASTIIAGRLVGLSPARAAEFSFLVSIPVMLGVILKLCVKESDRLYFADNAVLLILGNAAALLSGLAAVGFLMRYLETRSLSVFGWYRIGLGVAIVLVLLVQ